MGAKEMCLHPQLAWTDTGRTINMDDLDKAPTRHAQQCEGDGGNWKDHIFEAPDVDLFGPKKTAWSRRMLTRDLKNTYGLSMKLTSQLTSIVQYTNYQWAIPIQENLRLNARLGRWIDAAELWLSTSRSLVSVTITISIFACRRNMGRSGQTRGTMVSRPRSDVDQSGSMAWAKGEVDVWTFAWMAHKFIQNFRVLFFGDHLGNEAK